MPASSLDLLRKRCSGVGNDRVIGGRGGQFAGAAITQKLIERGLNPLFCRIRTAVAHPGVLKLSVDDIDALRLCLLGGRQHAGIGPEVRVLGAE